MSMNDEKSLREYDAEFQTKKYNRVLNSIVNSDGGTAHKKAVPPKCKMSTSSYVDFGGKVCESKHGYKHYEKEEGRLIADWCDDTGQPIPNDDIGAAMPDLRQYRSDYKDDPSLFSDDPSQILEDTLMLSGLKNSVDFTAPSVYKESKYAKKQEIGGLLVCYINVGQLPEYRIPAHLDEIKETWAGTLKTLPTTYKVIFLPVRHSDTRIELVKL